MARKEKALIYSPMNFVIKDISEPDYRIKAVFSTSDQDRHGEIVDQKGWKLDEFRQNPVLLFAHNHYDLAVGNVPEIGVVGDQLEGVVQFAAKEYPFAKVLFDLYVNKFMRAFSAGFANENYEYVEATDQIILRDNILYEMSAVNVPACARALAKNKGIDMEPLEKIMETIDARRRLYDLSEKSIADLSKSITESLRADTSEKPTENVETPQRKGGRIFSVREVNKQIRLLLKTKHNIQ